MSVVIMHPHQADRPAHIAPIVVDRTGRRVLRAGRELRPGPTEFRLLEFLASQPGRVFSRSEIREGTWGANSSIDIRTVDAHIRRLRQLLGRDAIRTTRGRGYGVNEKVVSAY